MWQPLKNKPWSSRPDAHDHTFTPLFTRLFHSGSLAPLCELCLPSPSWTSDFRLRTSGLRTSDFRLPDLPDFGTPNFDFGLGLPARTSGLPDFGLFTFEPPTSKIRGRRRKAECGRISSKDLDYLSIYYDYYVAVVIWLILMRKRNTV